MPNRASCEERRARTIQGGGIPAPGGSSDSNELLLDRAIEVFQPRTSRKLTREDAREIAHNLTGFFSVLLDWHHAEQAERDAAPATAADSPVQEDRFCPT